MIKAFLISILLFCSGEILAQDTTMVQFEAELDSLLQQLRSAENDQQKKEYNAAFKVRLAYVLQKNEAFNYPFTSLTTIGFIDSPDNKIRIVNWNVEQDDKSQIYYCFVLNNEKKNVPHKVIELRDVSPFMPGRPSDIVNAEEWYGALYYKIIPFKKGSKMVYVVLGWDGNTQSSNLKIIDAMYFSGNTVKLGSPIFKVGEEINKRMYYEHSEKVTMSLKYEENRGRIIFDHLSPESPSLKGFYSYYVPDFTYDAFVIEGNKWVLKEDVVGVNSDKQKEKQFVYVMNEKTGKVEKKEIKAEWQNPSDDNSPAGGNNHVAVTPEDEKENKDNSGNKNEKKDKLPKTKKDKRDPSELSSINGGKKKRWWKK